MPEKRLCRGCGKSYWHPRGWWEHEKCDVSSAAASRVTSEEVVEVAPAQALPARSAKAARSSTVKHPLKHEMRELGRRGGLAGGVERARRLSPERRAEIARAAARARWGKP